MAEVVRLLLLVKEAWVQSQTSPCGFVVERASMEVAFLSVLRFFPFDIIPYNTSYSS
jgi:hypothetical protein